MTIEAMLDAFTAAFTAVENSTGVKMSIENFLLGLVLLHVGIAMLAYCAASGSFKSTIRGLFRRGSSLDGDAAQASDVVRYLVTNCEAGNPEQIMQSVEEYRCEQKARLMDVGHAKGQVLDKALLDCNPGVVLEMGGFFGYSAVRMARLLKKPGAKVYSMEYNPECAKTMLTLIEHSKLQDRIQVIVGAASDSIGRFQDLTGATKVDFVLIDHDKPLYVPDLKALEAAGLLHKGTVIVADNILYPGCPEYFAYMADNPRYTTAMHPVRLRGKRSDPSLPGQFDAVAVSVYNGK